MNYTQSYSGSRTTFPAARFPHPIDSHCLTGTVQAVLLGHQAVPLTHVHAYTRTHRRNMHTQHTNIHTHTQTDRHTHTHTRTHTHTHAHTRTRVATHIHTHTHTHTHVSREASLAEMKRLEKPATAEIAWQVTMQNRNREATANRTVKQSGKRRKGKYTRLIRPCFPLSPTASLRVVG